MSAFPGGMTFPGERFHRLTVSLFRLAGQYLVAWFPHTLTVWLPLQCSPHRV
jgi:hypothetical protein